MNDYPDGDGLPTCPECRGRGVVPVPREHRPESAVGELTQRCRCVLIRDVLKNLERGWRGLSKAPPVKESPLKGKDHKNLWITASDRDLRSHLKHVAARMGPSWYFSVISDADLMAAWLSRSIPDDEIMDPDIGAHRKSSRTSQYISLEDVVDPPTLLIIRLGVKAARNVAMPEVLLEAIQHRRHVDKPIWIVDKPGYVLQAGHIAWDEDIEGEMFSWKKVILSTVAEGAGELPSIDAVTARPPSVNLGAQASTPARKPQGLLDPTDGTTKGKKKAWQKKGGRG